MVMQLLALRGGNLTSLGDRFSLDFTGEPLAGAGLFAITGPTGSGKSTLLDAVCLALYDQIPRLADTSRRSTGSAGGRADKASERLPAHDVRQMLRQGATEGFAEVDFADGAGIAYRARWQIRRARLRVGGRLQAQELVLTRLDTDKVLGGTKTETLAAIRERVGLDFGQFRRSVLLAQGDFDAFLRAQPKDRASLLELITGTEIYGRISRAAHVKATSEKEELKLLTRRLGDIQSLPLEDRASLETEQADVTTTIEALTTRHTLLKTDADWYRREADLAASVEIAAAALDLAQQAERNSAAERERLQRVRLALPLAPLLLAVTRAAERAAALEGEIKAGDAELASAQIALQAQSPAREEAERALTAAEAELDGAQPLLTAAIDLDRQIEREASDRSNAEDALTAAAAARTEAEAAYGNAVTAYDRAQESIDAADRWMEVHTADRLLAENVERVCQDIESLAQRRLAAAEIEARMEALTAEASELSAAVEDDHTAEAALTAELAERRSSHDSLRQALAGIDVGGLARRRDTLAQLRLAIERAGRTAGDVVTRTRRLADLDREAEEARHAATLAAETIDALERKAGALESARSELNLATATGSEMALQLRTTLTAGKPCPVCGATDHPYHGDPAAVAAASDESTEQAAAAQRELDELNVRIDEERRRSLTLQARIDGYGQHRAVLTDELQRMRSEWDDAADFVVDHGSEAGIAINPPSVDAGEEGLVGPGALAEAEHAIIVAAIEDASELSTELQQSASELARVEQALAARRQTLAAAGEQRHRIETELARGEAEHQEHDAADQRETARLQPVLSSVDRWSDMVPRHADELKQRCRKIAATWRAKAEERAQAAETLPQLSTKIGMAQAALQHAQADCDKHQAAFGDHSARLSDLKTQRDGLLNGRPATEVRTELEQAVAAAKQSLSAARDAEADAASTRTRLSAALDERRLRLSAAAADLQQTAEDRDRGLTNAGLSIAEAEEMIALGNVWAEATETRLQTLADEAMRAATVLSERRQVLADHRSRHPTQPQEGLDDAIADVTEELANGRERAAAIASRLVQDDDRRRLQAAAEAEIEGHRKDAERWLAVDDLIGSADGSAFRRFAQSLTLERLLALANRHLGRLAPRYRLQRVPGADMDLQVVDQDLGDDVRSVGSLSGGETFLASLALALALANMSSGDALADCLFIDEGFGSLDADSLETAISALEALQATGRRVGIISHVDAIVERIAVQVRLSRIAPGKSTVSVVRT